ADPAAAGAWLVFVEGDAASLGGRVASRLAAAGAPVVTVVPGSRFERLGPGTFALDPRRRDDYGALLATLEELELRPARIVHLWGLPTAASFEAAQDLGLLSLLYLAQAFAESGLERLAKLPAGAAPETPPEVRALVVSSGGQRVTADDPVRLDAAPLLALAQALPRELPGLSSVVADVVPTARRADKLALALLAELDRAD